MASLGFLVFRVWPFVIVFADDSARP